MYELVPHDDDNDNDNDDDNNRPPRNRISTIITDGDLSLRGHGDAVHFRSPDMQYA